jgi:3-oxoisoapionate kinase
MISLRGVAGLGRALDGILQATRLQRAVLAGGDTSGHALQAMAVYALGAIAPLVSGAPLCRAASDREHANLQIALEGGQAGGDDLFCLARDGMAI